MLIRSSINTVHHLSFSESSNQAVLFFSLSDKMIGCLLSVSVLSFK